MSEEVTERQTLLKNENAKLRYYFELDGFFRGNTKKLKGVFKTHVK